MARLFLFAIGGTGSRVLKSLIMLLASGVKPKSEEPFEIVPVIIDPHDSNEDLIRTKHLLEHYQKITIKIGLDNGFFSTRICTLDNLECKEDLPPGSFTFDLKEVAKKKFGSYIDYSHMDKANKLLTELLFSGTTTIGENENEIKEKEEKVKKEKEATEKQDKNLKEAKGPRTSLLDIDMDIGFVGNPNIGSVVLNQFKDSREFKKFASNFNEQDRIFIVSSIFGGTGAAGFPTVLKNIRNAKNTTNIDGKGFLENAKIGAISVLPYFNIATDPGSPIQKSVFIAKSKAALHYYKDNVTGNNSVNALYYIGDDYIGQEYKNDSGAEGQKNDAHFIELASALAIIDFLKIPDRDLQSKDGKAISPVYKEFGIKNDKTDGIRFSDLEDYTEMKLSLPLSQLALFRKYLKEHLDKSIGKQAWSTDSPEINDGFIYDNLYRTDLTEFLNLFGEWLDEMAKNKRAFKPFNLDSNSNIETLIADRPVKRSFWSWLWSDNVDYFMFDDILAKISKGKKYVSAMQKLIWLFHEATEKILIQKFTLKKFVE